MKFRPLMICLIPLSILYLSACDGRINAGRNILDVDPPQLVESMPQPFENSVYPYSAIIFTFNEPVDPSSIDSGVFLTCGGVNLAVTTESEEERVVVTPLDSLPLSAECSVTMTGLSDLQGNPMATPVELFFTTMVANPNHPPLLMSLSPKENATGVYPEEIIKVRFDDDVDPLTVNGDSFSVSDDQGTVPGLLVVSGDTVTFTPAEPFPYGKNYTVTLTGGIRTRSGASLQHDFGWTFSTLVLVGEVTVLATQQEPPYQPRVHSDDSGRTLFVWAQSNGAAGRDTSIHWTQREAGAGWDPPVVLVDSADDPILEHILAGNGKGDRFLILRRFSGWWSLRYDGFTGQWGPLFPLEDLPVPCGGSDVCLGSEMSLAVGPDGSAHLIFVETSENGVRGTAHTKGYDPRHGWQPVEELEDPLEISWNSGLFWGRIICNPGRGGESLAAWIRYPIPGDPYTQDLKTARYTPETGWGESELVITDTAYPGIFPGATLFDPSGTQWLFWNTNGFAYGISRRASGWTNPHFLGEGKFGDVLFDSSGSAMVLIDDNTRYSHLIRVAPYSPSGGWGTQYHLLDSGRFRGWMGDPGTRAVALFSRDGYLWRAVFTPEGSWSSPEAVGPDLYGIDLLVDPATMATLPDGTTLLGSVIETGQPPTLQWKVGVTEFY